MSMNTDIDGDFAEMIARYPEMEHVFQELRFNVYDTLGLVEKAEGVVRYCQESGIPVTPVMEAYVPSCTEEEEWNKEAFNAYGDIE